MVSCSANIIPLQTCTMNNIRNFSIIAHIDHGKSTLADRLIQLCGMVSDREYKDQLLDNMDIERERGITIKSQTICLPYTSKAGKNYILNLVDTPGHVDFSYEVSRALSSCEGALLLIDAAQGIEAQTLANLYLAMENDLAIIPVINKIDLPAADPERVATQIEDDLGLDAETIQRCSAKTGEGVPDLLEAIIALPDQLFYNTGISTYIWIVTDRKTKERKGKVQLINATGSDKEDKNNPYYMESIYQI